MNSHSRSPPARSRSRGRGAAFLRASPARATTERASARSSNFPARSCTAGAIGPHLRLPADHGAVLPRGDDRGAARPGGHDEPGAPAARRADTRLAKLVVHSGARVDRWEEKAGFNFLYEYESSPTPAVPDGLGDPARRHRRSDARRWPRTARCTGTCPPANGRSCGWATP